jgi:hypothetical protein
VYWLSILIFPLSQAALLVNLVLAGVALGFANVAFGDFCFYLAQKNGCWR